MLSNRAKASILSTPFTFSPSLKKRNTSFGVSKRCFIVARSLPKPASTVPLRWKRASQNSVFGYGCAQTLTRSWNFTAERFLSDRRVCGIGTQAYCFLQSNSGFVFGTGYCTGESQPLQLSRGLSLPKDIGLQFSSRGRHFFSGKGSAAVCEPVARDTMAESAMVELDEQEEQLFKTLLSTLKYHGLNTQLRVAGGWVRDKLLGKACKDIDIALDNMLGKDFADKVYEYLISINEETRRHHVIQSNPDQSKHLETATMMVHGLSIDFVNLRAEEYASGSRIPTMVFGTPEQDAYRRDLTINSLFYNVNTGAVEDFTKQGLADLRDGIIRTPLPPVQTFLDDPLRVLRAVRFGSRFGFKLDPDLVEAASSPEVRGALEAKVSRERVGIEVDKMLGGPNAELAMNHLAALHLFSSVFTVPPGVTSAVPPEDYGQRCVGALRATSNVAARVRTREGDDVGEEESKLVRMAGLLLPLRKVVEKDRKGKEVPVTQSIVMEALKLKADYARVIALLHTGAEEFRQIAPVLEGTHVTSSESHGEEHVPGGDDSLSSPTARKRIAAGQLLKRLKHMWRSSLLLSPILDQSETAPFGAELAEVPLPEEPNGREEKSVKAAEFYRTIESAVVELGLERVWEVKPVLDGKAIMATLGIQGREMAVWVGQAGLWQLANPQGSAEECRSWLKKTHSKTS